MQLFQGQTDQRQRRAQAGPLGLLLVFAIVIAATTLLVVLGANSIGGTQETLDGERAEKAMTQLDSQAALVALGNSNVQQVDLSSRGTNNYDIESDSGRMTLSYLNQTTGDRTTIFSKEMGRVVYESDDESEIAYQGGGVWRSDGDGNAVMISPPEFHYRDATLTLPLVTVGSSGTVDDRAVISRAKNTRHFPNEARNSAFQNPLENARVQVTVTSAYYRAWGEYFETRTDGEVEFDHENNKVTLTLVSPLENTRITSATASLSASGTFRITGSSGNICDPEKVYLDSYNSSGTSDGYCAQTPTSDGDIVYGGNVDISKGSGDSDIYGDIVAGGAVEVGTGGGQPDVYGNINHTDDCDNCEGRIKGDGSVNQISGIEEAPSINGIVQTQVNATENDNDNDDTSVISGETIDFSSGSPTIDSGAYYLEDLSVPAGETLTLDTTDGNITIGVKEDVALGEGAAIEVVGDETANVYVRGTGGNDEQLSMGKNSAITNPGDDAPQFRMFGQDNFTAAIGTSGGNGNLAKFVGVIYAPPGTAGSGEVTLNGGVIYGGVLTGTTTIEAGSIHYDKALENQRVLQPNQNIVRVTYIHASTNEISVEEG